MNIFYWREDFLTGIKEIDDQHRILFKYLEELQNFSIRDSEINSDEVYRNVSDTWTFAVKHFFAEESLMKDLNYPEFQTHRTSHQRIASNFMELKNRIKNKKVNKGDLNEFCDLIFNWFTEDTLPLDQKFAIYLKEDVNLGKKLLHKLKKYFTS